jgi:hypothetical protein
MIGPPRLAAATIAATLAIGGTALATPLARTFVATSGNDSAPCSLAAPCRSFAGAIAKTTVGGEVVVLQSGGYGPVTITQAVTISTPDGMYAGISVFAGASGITVNAPTDAVVALQGLTINGQGGANGVEFLQGATLRIERCRISSMSDSGIVAQLAAGSELQVVDTAIESNANAGIRASGAGHITLTRLRVAGNNAFGLLLQDGPDALAREVTLERNNWGVGAFATTGDVLLDMRDSRIFSNSRHGLWAQSQGAGTNTVSVTVSDSDILRNNQVASVPSGGVFVQANLATAVSVTLMRDRIANNHGAGVYVELKFPSGNALAQAFVDQSLIQANTGFGATTVGGATIFTGADNTIIFNAGGNLNGNVVSDGQIY